MIWQGKSLSGQARRALARLVVGLRDSRMLGDATAVELLVSAITSGRPRSAWPVDEGLVVRAHELPGFSDEVEVLQQIISSHIPASAKSQDRWDTSDVDAGPPPGKAKAGKPGSSSKYRVVLVHTEVDKDGDLVGTSLCGAPRVRLVPCPECDAISRRKLRIHVQSPRRHKFVFCGMLIERPGTGTTDGESSDVGAVLARVVPAGSWIEVSTALSWLDTGVAPPGLEDREPCPSCSVNVGRWDAARRSRSGSGMGKSRDEDS